eukprot:2808134-Rhodomonas_salina.1
MGKKKPQTKKRQEKLEKFEYLIELALYSKPAYPLELQWSEKLFDTQIKRSFAAALIAKRLEDLKHQWITLQDEKEAYDEYERVLASNDSEKQALADIFDLQGRGQRLHEKTFFLQHTLQQMDNDKLFVPASSDAIPWQGPHSHEIKVLQIESKLEFLRWLNRKAKSALDHIYVKLRENSGKGHAENIQYINSCVADLLHNIALISNEEVSAALRELKAWDKEHGKPGDMQDQNAWKMIAERTEKTTGEILHFIRIAQQYKQRGGFMESCYPWMQGGYERRMMIND